MRYGKVLLSVVAIVLCISSTSFAAGPERGRAAAEQALQGYKEKANATDYGFQDQDELMKATIGDSLPIYRLEIGKAAQKPATIGEALSDLGLVEFAVNANGRNVTRLTLRKSGDEFSRNGFGGSGEALARGLALLPAEARPEVKLVRFGPAEFLYMGLNKQELMVYLGPTPLHGIESHKVYTAAQILPQLQQLAQSMMANAGNDSGIEASRPGGSRNAMGLVAMSLVGAILLAGLGLYLQGRRAGSH
jgi:hypothetical protein